MSNLRAGAPSGRRQHSHPCWPSPVLPCTGSRFSGATCPTCHNERLTPSRNGKWQPPCQGAAATFQQTGDPQLRSPPSLCFRHPKQPACWLPSLKLSRADHQSATSPGPACQVCAEAPGTGGDGWASVPSGHSLKLLYPPYGHN